MLRGKLLHGDTLRDTKAHVNISRKLFILHSDINLKLYFEKTSHTVIQMAFSLITELILCMNHKLN